MANRPHVKATDDGPGGSRAVAALPRPAAKRRAGRILALLPVTAAILVGAGTGSASGSPVTTPAAAMDRADAGAWVSGRSTGHREIPAPGFGRGAWVAKVLAPARGRTRLKHPRTRKVIGTRTSWSGQAQILMILGSATWEGRQWLRLKLAERPNNSSAWFPADRMKIRRVPWWVKVTTGRRTVTIYRNGRRVRKFRAVVGARATPTPTGLAAIYERNRQPSRHGFIGAWSLSITSLSNVLDNYGGGPGRVAIHGRGGASFADPLGTARSHGCIRINNGPVTWMAGHIPKGTPVRIVR